MKEYFSHDYSTREDEKIKRLLFAHSWNGYGLYWAIIESLYQNNGFMLLDYDSIAFDMRTDKNTIDSIINGFELFKFKENKFYSESVLRRLKERKIKSEKASLSAKTRWNKGIKANANALRSESESNAIKEKKSKEYNILNAKAFLTQKIKELYPEPNDWEKEQLNKFFLYWTEPNKSQTKVKYEMQKTWDLQRRINTWFDNAENRFKK